MRQLMIKSFIDTACKSCTPTNIVYVFNKCGISPLDSIIIRLCNGSGWPKYDSPTRRMAKFRKKLQKLYMKEHNKPFLIKKHF